MRLFWLPADPQTAYRAEAAATGAARLLNTVGVLAVGFAMGTTVGVGIGVWWAVGVVGWLTCITVTAYTQEWSIRLIKHRARQMEIEVEDLMHWRRPIG